MNVTKRDGSVEKVRFDEITARLDGLMDGLNREFVDPVELATKVIAGLYDGVTTQELDRLAAETAATLTTRHPDYAKLAGRIAASNLQKLAPKSFSEAMHLAFTNVDAKRGEKAPLIREDFYQLVMDNKEVLDAAIVASRDLSYSYFGFQTMMKGYLLKSSTGYTIETPQYMLMRVALEIHSDNIQQVLDTYTDMSMKEYTHATPTLFNAGSLKPQMSSCFLLTMKDDSIDGIYDTLKQCAKISQLAGGIGLSVHNIRAKGSYIKGTGGTSNGLVPMLRNFDMTARYVDQGGGRRKGSVAIYLEPWHADIESFLDLKKNHGKEELRARDLFYALWISDLFMERVKEDKEWSLFCPNEAPGLADVYGAEFKALYEHYERIGKAREKVKAQELFTKIVESQIETGTPFVLFKDAANHKSNQKNLGTIKSSNLCTEIMEYTAPDEVAVCNLGSIALPAFVKDGQYDLERLRQTSYKLAINLNKVIDKNYYPVEEARKSNTRHRPIGIGVQGLADTFVMLGMPFDSAEAKALNRDIFETIYFGAMQASIDLAKQHGRYETFTGSPLSEGKFQFDLWNVTPQLYDWKSLREEVIKHGARNSLLLAPMPTASTSQILGYNECFEPFSSNLYTRRTLSGDFIVVNNYLVEELISLGLWNNSMRQRIMALNGSIQDIQEIPAAVRAKYKTVWEISQRVIIDLAADRGAYICQSQSMNLHLTNPTYGKMSSMLFTAWSKGLKTGMYYLRSTSAADAIKFTLDKTAIETEAPKQKTKLEDFASVAEYEEAKNACSIENPENCLMCGS